VPVLPLFLSLPDGLVIAQGNVLQCFEAVVADSVWQWFFFSLSDIVVV